MSNKRINSLDPVVINEWRWTSSHDVFKDIYSVIDAPACIGLKPKQVKPEWAPGDRGSVLLWAEQGIGDQIMFSTLIPDFIDRVDHLIVKVDKRLIPLLERSCGTEIEFIAQEKYINESEYDYQIAMGSLPRYLRTSEDSFKTSKRLKLEVDQDRSEQLRSKLLDSKYEKIIGISWKSA